MTKPLYIPAGRAREYSAYALNIYGRCDNKCTYCYVPRAMFRSDYFEGNGQPRANLLRDLKKQLSKETIDKQVLLSFMGDPYGHENEVHGMTRKVLEILLAHNVPVAILTKGGTNCLKDLDISKRFNGRIKIGASLTFYYPEDSLKYEPGAAWPVRRFEVLKRLRDEGIRNWASLEPIIDPAQALKIIEQTHSYVDHYKVGKINHCPELENGVDWDRFVSEAVTLLRSLNKPFYVKKSLQEKNRSTALTAEETDPDLLSVK